MNATRTIEIYSRKLDPAYIGAVFTKRLSGMFAGYQAAASDKESIEGLTRGALSLAIAGGSQPSVLQAARFQALASEFLRARDHYFGGTVLTKILDTIAGKWYARGLDPVYIAAILFDVFGCSSLAPAAFTLNTPANHASSVPVDGDLTWHASAGATHYAVYLWSFGGTKPSNPTAWRSALLSQAYTYSSLLYLTKYSWSVTAYRFTEPLACTADFDFTTVAA
jgi:hypothetical protein